MRILERNGQSGLLSALLGRTDYFKQNHTRCVCVSPAPPQLPNKSPQEKDAIFNFYNNFYTSLVWRGLVRTICISRVFNNWNKCTLFGTLKWNRSSCRALCRGEAKRGGWIESPEGGGGGGGEPAGRADAPAQRRGAPTRLPCGKPARSPNAQTDVQELLAVHILFFIIIIIVL